MSFLAPTHNYSPLVIDGGILEGGGQILRIATTLAGILRRPIQVVNIRGNRPKPGLMAQHLTGLRLAAEITGGQLSGDSIGSLEIRFKPGRAAGEAGQYVGDTRTAGSVTLLLQSTLPILVFGSLHQCSLLLKGGTNVGMAPQLDYTTSVLAPLLARFGVHFALSPETVKRGYYPRGGGEVVVNTAPLLAEPMQPIELVDRGEVTLIEGYCWVAGGGQPLGAAKEAAEEARSVLKECYPGVPLRLKTVVEERVGNNGSGSGVVLTATTSTGCRLGGSALASRELPTPAALGRWAAGQLVRALETGAAVDEYAQDQLIIFMALASGRSRMLAGSELTLHTRTAMHIIEQMVPQIKFSVTPFPLPGKPAPLNLIEVDGIGFCAVRGGSFSGGDAY